MWLPKSSSKLLALFALVLTVLFTSSAKSYAYFSLGQPKGYVNDYARVLTDSQRAELENKLTAFTQQTSSEISVVIIQSLQGDYIENFAEKLFKEWKIGTAKNDNGVLLLVAVDDRELRIEVGYGLEGALTDSLSGQILNNEITPQFKQGKYFEGINAGVDAIIAVTKGEYTAESSDGGPDLSPFLVLGFMAFQFLGSLMARSKSWWFGGVLGFILGIICIILAGFALGIVLLIIFVLLGLLLDYLFSKHGGSSGGGSSGSSSSGGFGGSKSSGGGFGGFSGGSSGGGGSSGRW